MLGEELYEDAERLLEALPDGRRNAEWHFLRGCLYSHAGFFIAAQESFNAACDAEPDNDEYRHALDEMNQSLESSADEYKSKWRAGGKRKRGINLDSEGTLICCECCCEGCAEGACEAICESCDCS